MRTIRILLLASLLYITLVTLNEATPIEKERPGRYEVWHNRTTRKEYRIVEGDIKIPLSQGRNGILGKAHHWPNGVIPYEINGKFSDSEMDVLMKGMEEFHKYTCIKFVKKTPTHDNYISIVREPDQCSSYVGLQKGKQEVNYGTKCLVYVAQAIHELMHAVGVAHEHNRADRDEFIEVKMENVLKGYEFDFNKVDPKLYSDYGVPYNYYSVMHYEEYSFSKEDGVLPTMVAKKKHDKPIGGVFGNAFADTDIKKINLMYNCKCKKH